MTVVKPADNTTHLPTRLGVDISYTSNNDYSLSIVALMAMRDTAVGSSVERNSWIDYRIEFREFSLLMIHGCKIKAATRWRRCGSKHRWSSSGL